MMTAMTSPCGRRLCHPPIMHLFQHHHGPFHGLRYGGYAGHARWHRCVSADIDGVVKILDIVLGTLHTLATLVRSTHWGVTRGSDSTLGQGLAHLTSL